MFNINISIPHFHFSIPESRFCHHADKNSWLTISLGKQSHFLSSLRVQSSFLFYGFIHTIFGILTTQASWHYSTPTLQHKNSLVVQMVKNVPTMQETRVPPLGWEDPLEKGMVTHSTILAWEIPWTKRSLTGVAKSRTWLSDWDFHFTLLHSYAKIL